MIDEFVRGFVQGVFIGGIVWGFTASVIILMFIVGTWKMVADGILKLTSPPPPRTRPPTPPPPPLADGTLKFKITKRR